MNNDQINSKEILKIEKMAKLLDSKFKIFGIRFGVDPIIGLIPGIGDLVTNIIGAYPIQVALNNNLSKAIIIRMVFNLVFDYVIGIVPLFGDIFDIAFKANTRNYDLLVKGLKAPKTQSRKPTIFVGFIFLLLGILAILPFVMIYFLIKSFSM